MPASDSTESDNALGRENAPRDNYLETGPSPTLVVACGLSVTAFATFVAMTDTVSDNSAGGLVAFVLTIPFFFGAYAAVHGFFGGLEKVTSADD